MEKPSRTTRAVPASTGSRFGPARGGQPDLDVQAITTSQATFGHISELALPHQRHRPKMGERVASQAEVIRLGAEDDQIDVRVGSRCATGTRADQGYGVEGGLGPGQGQRGAEDLVKGTQRWRRGVETVSRAARAARSGRSAHEDPSGTSPSKETILETSPEASIHPKLHPSMAISSPSARSHE